MVAIIYCKPGGKAELDIQRVNQKLNGIELIVFVDQNNTY